MAITQEQVNEQNMSLKDLSIATTPNATPADRIAQGRVLMNQGMTGAEARRAMRAEPTVSANDLATPVTPVAPPVPAQPSPTTGVRTGGLVDSVAQGTQQFIQAQTEEARKRDELANLLGEQEFNAAGQRQMFNEQFGLPANLQRLRDLETQLASANTESRLLQTQIAGKAGQTLDAGRRAITQEDRENAIRTAGIAAEAAVLQGNIETAQTLINSAMQDFYADRQLRNQNIIQQLEYFSGIADQQTAQLLQQEQRKYEEDQRQIIRAEAAVDSAVASGYASPEDIKSLTNLAGNPEMQRDVAIGIVARGAVQERILQQAAQRASIAASSTARRRNLVELGLTGDPQAIAELGFDPRTQLQEEIQSQTAEETAKMEVAAGKENERLQKTLDDLTYLMGNKTGLEASSGQFRNATISGLTPFAGDSLSEISGGLPGAIKARSEKDDWLAVVGRLVTEDGFESLIDINERVRLTPITNAEIDLAFRAAGELQNAAIKKGSSEEGTQRIVGFRMSEQRVRENLAQMYLATQKAQEEAAFINQYGYDALLELQQLQAEAQSE